MRSKQLSKLKLFVVVTLIIAALVIGRQVLFVHKATEMNVLLISIDTLSPSNMSTYGYKKKTTPNIDRLAREAFVFTNATTVVPITHPSLSMLMTGRSAFETRIVSNSDPSLSSSNKSLAARLYEVGYKTAAFISADNSLTQGFEKFDFKYNKPQFLDVSGEIRQGQNEDDTSKVLVEDANKWIRENKTTKFFAWVHLSDPHAPYMPPEGLRCKFNSKYCDEMKAKSTAYFENLRAKFQSCQEIGVDENTKGVMQALYDGAIASADIQVGNILRNLEKEGLTKKTIVIIYGDHGEGFDHNYYFNHGEALYQSSIRIPLIIKDPRSFRKGVVDRVVQNIDILPTLLDLLRVNEEKPNVSGQSFASLFYPISYNPSPRKYSYYLNSSYTKFAISDGRFKYIMSHPASCLYKNQEEELYDLFSDPEETTNLITSKTNIAYTLKSALNEYLGVYNLPLYTKDGVVTRDAINKLNELNSLKNF